MAVKIGPHLASICLLVVAAAAAPLRAADLTSMDAVEERRRVLASREAEINHTSRDLELVQRFVGQMQDLRDNKLYGAHGLTGDINSWNDDMRKWLDSWTPLAGSFAGLNEDNALRGLDDLQVALRERNTALSVLLARAETISNSSSHIQLAIDDLAETTLKDQGDVMRRLNVKKADMSRAVDAIAATFQRNAIQYLSEATSATTDLVRAKLRILAVSYPHLELALANARATLDFMDRYSVRLYTIRQHSEQVVEAIGKYRGFCRSRGRCRGRPRGCKPGCRSELQQCPRGPQAVDHARS